MPSSNPATNGNRPSWPQRVRLKLIGLGVRSFFGAKRLAYRARPGPKLRHVDHITVPCDDLGVAEAFYVGVLGAKVMMRIDEKMLRNVGWTRGQIEAAHAVHLSLTLQSGPRIDLFRYPEGKPRPDADMHPHIALMAARADYLGWKRRLDAEGVITSEIMRPGPPGQASFYFNDPFGNHLEIITLGFAERTLSPGVPDRSHLDYSWRPPEIRSRFKKTRTPLQQAMGVGAVLMILSGGMTADAQESLPGAIIAEVRGLRSDRGMVDCYLFASAGGFPGDPGKARQRDVVAISGNGATCQFSGVARGPHAIAVVHDENGNGKLDRNFMGVPAEGVGASNNPVSHFGPPKFADARFEYGGGAKTLSVQVHYP